MGACSRALRMLKKPRRGLEKWRMMVPILAMGWAVDDQRHNG